VDKNCRGKIFGGCGFFYSSFLNLLAYLFFLEGDNVSNNLNAGCLLFLLLVFIF